MTEHLKTRDSIPPSMTCMEGPFETVLKVAVTDGKDNGTIEVNMGHGITPTIAEVQEALQKAALALSKSGAVGFKFMTRKEYMQHLLSGSQNVDIPGPAEFPNADLWVVPKEEKR